MGMTDIAIVAAAALSFAFPAALINAIRSTDEKEAAAGKLKSCILLCLIVFLSLAVVNS